MVIASRRNFRISSDLGSSGDYSINQQCKMPHNLVLYSPASSRGSLSTVTPEPSYVLHEYWVPVLVAND